MINNSKQEIKIQPCVYFISNQMGSIKIGITTNIEQRYKQLQTGNSKPLIIKHLIYVDSREEAYKMEQKLHYKFENYKSHRFGEWFKYDVVNDYLNSKYILKDNCYLYGYETVDEYNKYYFIVKDLFIKQKMTKLNNLFYSGYKYMNAFISYYKDVCGDYENKLPFIKKENWFIREKLYPDFYEGA